jgi:hypothetical protein
MKRWPYRWRQVLARAVCLLRGHDWSPWQVDDMDGPRVRLTGGGFMPYRSRESAAGEWGTRCCRRRCGTRESRWPRSEAPALWRAQIDWERRGRPSSASRG